MSRTFAGRRGFTLVELLVVIAIIGVLVALLLPAVQQAREAARRMQCGNNLKQYGLAMHTYHDIWNKIPSNTYIISSQWNAPNWQATILPQMEQQPLFDKINWKYNTNVPYTGFESQVNTPSNPLAAARTIQVPYARCPSDSSPENPTWAQTSYVGSMGSQLISSGCTSPTPPWSANINTTGYYYEVLYGTSPYSVDMGQHYYNQYISGVFAWYGFSAGQTISFAAVRDGLSNTIFMGEQIPECNGWGRDYGWWLIEGNSVGSTTVPLNTFTACAQTPQEAINKGYPYPNCAGNNQYYRNMSFGFMSRHPQVCQFVFGDGSVHTISQSVNYSTYQRLGGRRDGLPLGDY